MTRTTTFYDCVAIFLTFFFVLACFAVILLSFAATVYVIVWAAGSALKTTGIIKMITLMV